MFDAYAWSNNDQINAVLEAKLSETANVIKMPTGIIPNLAAFKLGTVYAAYERLKEIKKSKPRSAFVIDDKMALRALSEVAHFGEHHASSHARKVYIAIKPTKEGVTPVLGSFQLNSVLVNEVTPLISKKIADETDTCIVINAREVIEFTAIAQRYKILGGNFTYIDTMLEDGKAIVAMCAKASVENIDQLSQFEVGSMRSDQKVEIAMIGFFHGEVKQSRPSLAYLDDMVHRSNDSDYMWLPMLKGVKSKAKTLTSEGKGFYFRSGITNSIEGTALNVFIEAEKDGSIVGGDAAAAPVETEHALYTRYRKAKIKVDNKIFLQALSQIIGNLELGLGENTLVVRSSTSACALSIMGIETEEPTHEEENFIGETEASSEAPSPDKEAEVPEADGTSDQETKSATKAPSDPLDPDVLDFTIVCDNGVYDKETDRIVFKNAYVFQNKKGEVERITIAIPVKEVRSVVKHKKEKIKPAEQKKIGKKTTLKYKILDLIKERAVDREISLLEILEHLPSETNQGSVNAALSFLVKSGVIKRTGVKKYQAIKETEIEAEAGA